LGEVKASRQVTVFGGTGYLGGCAGRSLKGGGFRTVLASRAMTIAPESRWADLNVRVCWEDERSIRTAILGSSTVVHAAGPDADACSMDPEGSTNRSGRDARSIAEAAIAVGTERIIVISTVHAGAARSSAYGRAALARERATESACLGSGTKVVVLRVANCFGAPATRAPGCWKLVVNSMGLQAMRGREIRLTTDGSAFRDFVPVSALAECILLMATLQTERLAGGTIEACSGRQRSILEMARLIRLRCETLFGFTPAIRVGSSTTAAQDDTPRPDPAALNRLGIFLPADPVPEIDALLRFCSTAELFPMSTKDPA
jgi:nucleoside-diphosphate-sugar epimerase